MVKGKDRKSLIPGSSPGAASKRIEKIQKDKIKGMER